MKIVKADAAGLEAAIEVLKGGGVAVIPTDTVYGLAAHPDFPAAVERLYTIKARDAKKPIALLASDARGAATFIGADAANVGAKRWPGALTVVSQGEGVRVPDHDWTRRLIAACGGALRVTSANLSGQRAATDAPQALKDIGLSADLVVDDGVSPGGTASTVIKIDDGRISILRDGPVKFLTLASGSPRRAKILKDHGVDFVIVKSDAPEVSYPHDPERTVRENALAKGALFNTEAIAKTCRGCISAKCTCEETDGFASFRAFHGNAPTGKRGFAIVSTETQRHGDGTGVLSADTIVWFNNRIYGKPKDLDEAKEYLRELSGNVHTVFTGVAYDGDVKVVKSDVKFRDLSEAMIDEYVARVKPTDRAGAYDIDESGDLIVESYTGSYENIMGLPVEPLKEWGIVR